ncbi:hypothetical protein SPBR_05372 [Sporothrix brasiliensis 5110]|uniref:Transmembrane protein n=1 Tax=Sporothrix brasiliensis 5110 TaxID=1398154 RepID=A0A0C2F9E7_9PEZI|nr:uncharacterized protein SPBR_05372 [Sporothrix brasiliensis 5110]KIH87673.1 hypothetical protein SPBR_05372 [Sporothrix brasiliensis 5110]
MIIPSTTGDVLAPSASAASGADAHPGSSTINTAITSTSTTNNGNMNALTMFLFWFFLCSTGVLVVGSVVVLRRLRLREQARRAQEAKTAAATSTSTAAHVKEMDEESSVGGSAFTPAPVLTAQVDWHHPCGVGLNSLFGTLRDSH